MLSDDQIDGLLYSLRQPFIAMVTFLVSPVQSPGFTDTRAIIFVLLPPPLPPPPPFPPSQILYPPLRPSTLTLAIIPGMFLTLKLPMERNSLYNI